MTVFSLIFALKVPAKNLTRDLSWGSILVQVLLSVVRQCQVAKDSPKLCSGWVPMTVFSLILELKVLAPELDKGFVIGMYFGMGTFECCRAMPSGQRFSKLLLWIGSNDSFHFEFPI